jgi:hypothetical protein
VNLADPFGLRPLTPAEREEMGNYCDQVDCDKVNVYDGTGTKEENARRRTILQLSFGHPITIGNDVFLSDDVVGSNYDFGTLADELAHVYQFQVEYKGDMDQYLRAGRMVQLSYFLYQETGGIIGRDEYDPGTLLVGPNVKFTDYGMEQ